VSAAAILREAQSAGVSLVLDPSGGVKIGGDEAEVLRWLPVLRQHKAEIARMLAAGQEPASATPAPTETTLPQSLAQAAMRLCDAYGDDEDARARMIEDLKTYPKAQWRWLRDYLNGEAERLERESARERFEERAAILEFEAGLTRAAARSEVADPDALHRCADCAHAEPTGHPVLVRCGAGREDYPLAGAFWMDDAKVCVAWTPAGAPAIVPVEDDEHAEWVQRMNPKPGK
jgi:hypothetical protein